MIFLHRVDFPSAIYCTSRDFPFDVGVTFSAYLVSAFSWACLLATCYVIISSAIAFIVLESTSSSFHFLNGPF